MRRQATQQPGCASIGRLRFARRRVAMAALTADGFNAYLSSSLQDNAAFLSSRGLPPAGRDSMVALRRRCGFDYPTGSAGAESDCPCARQPMTASISIHFARILS